MAMTLTPSRLRVTQAKYFGNAQTAGHVTSLTQGTGIQLTPNPIVATGTIAVSTVPVGNGGTGANLSLTGGASQYVKQVGVGANFTVGTIPYTDIGAGYVKVDGTTPLTGNWNAGNYRIDSQNSTRWFNVKAYGAIGNGVADDSAAFQLALDAANTAGGGTVYVPSGFSTATYLVKNLAIYSDTTLLGDGWNSVLKLPGTALVSDVILTNANTGAYTDSNIAIRDLKFDGNGNGAGGAQTRFVSILWLSHITHLLVENCWIGNIEYIALGLGACVRPRVLNCHFADTGYSGATVSGGPALWNAGILGDNPQNFIIQGNAFYNCRFGGITANGYRGVVANNDLHITGESAIFSSDDNVTYFARDISYLGNIIDTCTIHNISASGIEIGGRGASITGNHIRGVEADGISLSNTQDIDVTGNSIGDFGLSAPFLGSGIKVYNTAGVAPDQPKNILISGNTFYDNTGAPTAHSAIRLYHGGGSAASNITIQGNNIEPAAWTSGQNIVISPGAADATCMVDDVTIGSGAVSLSRNITVLPAPVIAGTVLQLGAADSATTTLELAAFAATPTVVGRRSAGTAASPSATQNGQALVAIDGYGYGTNAWSAAPRGQVYITAAEAWTNTAQGTRAIVSVTKNGTTTLIFPLAIENDGEVGLVTRGLSRVPEGVFYSLYADVTTTANNLTTILSGTGVGTLTLPVNFLVVGAVIRIKCGGYVSTADGGAGTKTLTLSLGGTTVATGTSLATFATGLNYGWSAEAVISCRSIGVGGTVQAQGRWDTEILGAATLSGVSAVSTGTTVINTTNAQAIDLKFNNGNAVGAIKTTWATCEYGL